MRMHSLARRYAGPVWVACALLAALVIVSHHDLSAQDDVRLSQVCLDCHTGQDASLAATPHRLRADALDGPEAPVACTDCHTGDRRHWEEDAEQYGMTDPSVSGARAEARLCSACHQSAHQQNMLERNVHTSSGVNCSACHSIHGSRLAGLLKKAERALCLDCHASVEGQFARPFRHPVEEGVVRCSECHLTLDETQRELSLNGTNVCMRCHGEFEGPFPYEHQATVDYSTDEGGCLTCHQAHGSYLPRLLKQPYAPPHFAICAQCHSVPRHNANAMHGTRWAGVPCGECHADIHGSYTSRLFLSESLEGLGCFSVGCHRD
jgi:DmsE family decaheme c-type cytochrome